MIRPIRRRVSCFVLTCELYQVDVFDSRLIGGVFKIVIQRLSRYSKNISEKPAGLRQKNTSKVWRTITYKAKKKTKKKKNKAGRETAQ